MAYDDGPLAGPPHVFRHHPLLGTVVELRMAATIADDTADRLDELIIGELDRLERIFSAFDRDSELERWKRGALDVAGLELSAVLCDALRWQLRSGGAFNPAVGRITRRWQQAAAEGVEPDDAELAALVEEIREPPFRIDDAGRARLVGDATGMNLNAFVKGWIVDRALEVAFASGLGAGALDLVINAGGDLAHRGPHAIPVGIENPLRPYDNEPPLTLIDLGDAALATSGRSRRGFGVGERWYSHVLDPRNGRPVDAVASISVVAADAATADVQATVLGMLDPVAVAAAADDAGVAVLVVEPSGQQHRNEAWSAIERAR